MKYRSVSDLEEAEARSEEAALRWLAQRLRFEAWLEGARDPAPKPDRAVAA